MLALAAILIEITRRRTLQRAEKLNLRFQERSAERERIALQIHDTFIQDLTGTALQLGACGTAAWRRSEVAQLSLSSLAARMREMVARSRDIVSNLHSMAGPQFSLIDLLTYVEAEFRLTEAPAYELSSDRYSTGPPSVFARRVIAFAAKRLPMRFATPPRSRIEVKIVFLPRKLIVTITDDGIGMSETIRKRVEPGTLGSPECRLMRADQCDAAIGKRSWERDESDSGSAHFRPAQWPSELDFLLAAPELERRTRAEAIRGRKTAVRMIAFEVVETDSLKVLIVDDHPMVREGLAGIFARHNISVTGLAANGQAAIAMFQAERPDVVLLDCGCRIGAASTCCGRCLRSIQRRAW
jgi:hypothetical protein